MGSVLVGLIILFALIIAVFSRRSSDKSPENEDYRRASFSPNAAGSDEQDTSRLYLDGQGPRQQVVSFLDELTDETVIQRTFMNVFSMAPDSGERLVTFYMKRHNCGRTEAMKRAVLERQSDEEKYR
jgi:hypothetical protein